MAYTVPLPEGFFVPSARLTRAFDKAYWQTNLSLLGRVVVYIAKLFGFRNFVEHMSYIVYNGFKPEELISHKILLAITIIAQKKDIIYSKNPESVKEENIELSDGCGCSKTLDEILRDRFGFTNKSGELAVLNLLAKEFTEWLGFKKEFPIFSKSALRWDNGTVILHLDTQDLLPPKPVLPPLE